MTVRALAVSAGTLALLVAAGCGPETNVEKADEKPKQTEQEKTPSPTPSPSTPEISEEPYVQVALEYYEAVNKAIKTGDAQRLRELSDESCKACYGTADRIEKIYNNGGRIEGGQTKPASGTDIKTEANDARGIANVTIVYKDAPATMVLSKGAKPKKFPEEHKKQQFTLKREGSEWVIIELLTSEYKG